MNRLSLVVSLVLLLACACGPSRTPSQPAPKDAAPTASASDARAQHRARELVEAQIANFRADTLESHARLRSHFADDAVVMWPSATPIESAIYNLRGWVLAEDPDEELADVRITRFESGGDDDAVWAMFELTSKVEPSEVKHVYGSVVMTRASGWKIVAAAYSPALPLRGGELRATMPAPPVDKDLEALLANPSELRAVVAPDAAVVVETRAAQRDEALGWLVAQPVAVAGARRAYRGGVWRVAQAHLYLGSGEARRQAAAQIVARESKGKLEIVAVHVFAL